MKKSKQLIALLIAACLLLPGCGAPTASSAAQSEQNTLSALDKEQPLDRRVYEDDSKCDIIYEVFENHVNIVLCRSDSEKLEIPTRLDGLPVKAISGFDCPNIMELDIPEGIDELGRSAFNLCKALSSVSMPNTLRIICENSFSGCGSLMQISIPSGVERIGHGAFAACISLTRVEFSEGLKKIGKDAFFNCPLLNNVALPSSIEEVEFGAFNECDSLTSLTIPDTVKYLGTAFRDTPWLDALNDDEFEVVGDGILVKYNGNDTEVVVPDGVKCVGGSVFSNNVEITSVLLPESVSVIGDSAFSDCTSLSSIALPSGLTRIEKCAFSCCPFEEIVLPSGVENIGSEAFAGCVSLASVTFPKELKIIGSYAFDGAFRFGCAEDVMVIPDTVTEIGAGAFQDTEIIAFEIPDTVSFVGCNAFAGTPWLENCENEYLVVGDGNLIACCGNESELIVPAGVKVIENPYLKSKDLISSIMLPEGVNWLGDNSFSEMSSLRTVTLPESIKFIGDGVLRNCPSLESAVVFCNLWKVGVYSFDDCPNLIITCPEGSRFVNYARASDIPFVVS